ncbi:MAG: NAD(P)H-dependent flavin oxidoreductase [Dehalococcoidia bacterium]
MLTTPLTRMFSIDHPIVQAGMSSDCGAPLAAAVSIAGALGTIGTIGRSPANLEQELSAMMRATRSPWSVNIVTFDWAPFAGDLLDVAIAARPAAITLSFGDSRPAIERCRAAGIPVIAQVQGFEQATAVLKARPDVLVVQGNEAGGHTGSRGTLGFAAQVLGVAGDVPVLVAGGVGNGRGLAAALAMGAAGAVMGTRFKATEEFGTPQTGHLDLQRAAIVANNGDATVWDEITDIAIGMKWPQGIAGRVLSNRFTGTWLGRRDALRTEVAAQSDSSAWSAANTSAPDTLLNWAGESAGLVHEILPAAEVVRRTVEDAESLLRQLSGVLSDGGSRA